MSVTPYTGPAGVILTPDEVLVLWQCLSLHPTAENADLRKKLANYLEMRDGGCDK